MSVKISHKGVSYVVDEAPGGRVSLTCECTPATWDEVAWPNDSELSKELGIKVAFFEAGEGQFEGVYAFAGEA